MEIEVVKLSNIYPYYNNPRDNSGAVAPVMESFRRYGFIKPIIVDKDYVIIAGHTRYIAAYQLGIEFVPVVVSDMSEEKAKMFRIADNKLAEKSTFDEAKLIEELKSLKIPEEMQSFFFEDINRMINFSYNQFQQQAQEAGADFNPADFNNEGSNEPFEEHFSPSAGEQMPEEAKPQQEGNGEVKDEFFKVLYRADGTKYMNVICPYCGNPETIDID